MNWKGGKIIKLCLTCKKEFKVSLYLSNKAKYCSKKCGYRDKESFVARVALRRSKGSYKISEATKLKMSNSQKGKKFSLETREKLKGRKPWNYRGMTIKEKSWLKNQRNRVIKRLRSESLSHTYGEWENLKKQYGYQCPCCKKTEPNILLTEDHIIPLSKGGSDLIENIQPLCRSCNSQKNTKIIKFLT